MNNNIKKIMLSLFVCCLVTGGVLNAGKNSRNRSRKNHVKHEKNNFYEKSHSQGRRARAPKVYCPPEDRSQLSDLDLKIWWLDAVKNAENYVVKTERNGIKIGRKPVLKSVQRHAFKEVLENLIREEKILIIHINDKSCLKLDNSLYESAVTYKYLIAKIKWLSDPYTIISPFLRNANKIEDWMEYVKFDCWAVEFYVDYCLDILKIDSTLEYLIDEIGKLSWAVILINEDIEYLYEERLINEIKGCQKTMIALNEKLTKIKDKLYVSRDPNNRYSILEDRDD